MPEHQQMQQSKNPDPTFQKQATPASPSHESNTASIIQRARTNPKSMTSADVLQLQRTIGNRAVGRLLSGMGKLQSTAQQAPVQRQEVLEEEEPLQGKMIRTVQRQEIPEEEEPLQGKMVETIQRQEIPEEEEPLQGKMAETVQHQEIPEEEEPLQGKMIETIQRQEIPEEEEPLQGKMIETVQRQEMPEDEELLQGKFETVQRQEPEEEELMQGKFTDECVQCQMPEDEEELMQGKYESGLTGTLQAKEEAPPNRTGMPDHLKSGLENISGMDLSGVRVQYSSPKPAQLNALAYTQGQEIHVAPGQEKHLPHEGWHAVQQMQGRVKPTGEVGGIPLNDSRTLESEADSMGRKALQQYTQVDKQKDNKSKSVAHSVTQKKSTVKQGFGFVDSRPEAIVQRKLQEMVNSSSQVKQMKLEADNDLSQNMGQSITQFARGKKSKHNRKAGRLAKTQGLERSIPIEEERGFSVVSQSETSNPYTSSEITEILGEVKPGDLFDIDPSRIRTMHAGISNRFSNDDEIIDLVEKLKKDPYYIDKTPTIKVSAIELPKRKWERQDELEQRNTKELTLFTEDHRRVVAARMAGIKKMKAQMKADPSVTGNFTTKNRGLSVDVRKYHETEEGRHQGGNKTTLPSSAKVYKYSESEE